MPCALRISEASSMGMHSMGLLALASGRPLSTRQIATCFSLSEAHLSKVLQRLVKVGLLSSMRGPKGGFVLGCDPDRTTLLEVFEAIEGKMEDSTCLFGVPMCDGRSCVLGDVMARANSLLMDHLSRTNLTEISKVFLDGRIDLPFPARGTSPSGTTPPTEVRPRG